MCKVIVGDATKKIDETNIKFDYTNTIHLEQQQQREELQIKHYNNINNTVTNENKQQVLQRNLIIEDHP